MFFVSASIPELDNSSKQCDSLDFSKFLDLANLPETIAETEIPAAKTSKSLKHQSV